MQNMRLLLFFSILVLVGNGIIGQTLTDKRVNPNDVTIVRDNWGVPHIYGNTDADAAYGLAWAHAEDDFATMQESLITMKGRLSEVKGVSGAITDVLANLLNIEYPIEAQMDTAFSPAFKKVLSGYVQGVNDYARTYPKQIRLKGIFPITEADVIKGYRLAQTVLSNSLFGIARILDNKLPDMELPQGSNAFAFSQHKMDDSLTTLISNTHQPIDGIMSWYEAHVCSNEGWNMLGATFSTGVTIFIGTNPNLGWTHTVNYPDFHDIYTLKMHPKKKLQYQFDGEWLDLKKVKVRFKVKIAGVKVPVSRTYYMSKYGLTFKNKSGFYAIRFPSSSNIMAAEQWFHMNKASNYQEFQEALAIQGLSTQNIIYADKDDNIYFIDNGSFPLRNPNYNWQGILPGDTSATLWPMFQYQPLNKLPQLLNPDCGYLYNANNTPFSATHPDQNLKPEDYDSTMGFLMDETNRGLRIQELFEPYEDDNTKMNYEKLKVLKYDQQYASETFYTNSLSNLDEMMTLDPDNYPDIADVLHMIQKWDRKTTTENTTAAILAVTITHVLNYVGQEVLMSQTNVIPMEVYVQALRKAKAHMLKHFGSISVPMSKVQFLVKGDKEIPIGGMPENLAPSFIEPYKNGTFKCVAGESYIQIARYDENGLQTLETIHPYGASNNPESKHYTDQMELFVNQKLKPMTLNRDSIFENAAAIYHPMPRVK